MSFILTLVLGIEYGLASSFGLAIFLTVFLSAFPSHAELSLLPGTKTESGSSTILNFVDKKKHPTATCPEHILIWRLEENLYYANSGFFKEKIKQLVVKKLSQPKTSQLDETSINEDASPILQSNDSSSTQLSFFILDTTSVNWIDVDGVHALQEIKRYLEHQSIKLLIASLSSSAFRTLTSSGFIDSVGEKSIFSSLHDAVSFASKIEEVEDEDL